MSSFDWENIYYIYVFKYSEENLSTVNKIDNQK